MDVKITVFRTMLTAAAVLSPPTSGEVQFQLFQSDSSFNNFLPTSGYILRAQRQAYSKAICALICADMPDCVSFFFEKTTSACQFHETRLNDTTGWTSSTHAVYYAAVPKECPPGTFMYESKCIFTDNTKRTFNETRAWCQANGGKILRVDSADENNFIKTLISTFPQPYYWLGLSEEGHRGTWTWVDNGETPTFTDWSPGQPQMNTENCGFYHVNGWHDIDCLTQGTVHSLCEKDL